MALLCVAVLTESFAGQQYGEVSTSCEKTTLSLHNYLSLYAMLSVACLHLCVVILSDVLVCTTILFWYGIVCFYSFVIFQLNFQG